MNNGYDVTNKPRPLTSEQDAEKLEKKPEEKVEWQGRTVEDQKTSSSRKSGESWQKRKDDIHQRLEPATFALTTIGKEFSQLLNKIGSAVSDFFKGVKRGMSTKRERFKQTELSKEGIKEETQHTQTSLESAGQKIVNLEKQTLTKTNVTLEEKSEDLAAPLVPAFETAPLVPAFETAPPPAFEGAAAAAAPPPPPPLPGMGAPQLKIKLMHEPDPPKYKISTEFQKSTPIEIEKQIDDIKVYLKELKEAVKPLQDTLKEAETIAEALKESNIRLKDDKDQVAKFNENIKTLNENPGIVTLISIDNKTKERTKIPYFPDNVFDEINQKKAQIKEPPLPIHLKKSVAIKEMEESANELTKSIEKETKTRDELTEKLTNVQKQENGKYLFKDFHDIVNNAITGKAKLINDWERAIKVRQSFLQGKVPAAQPVKIEVTGSPLEEEYAELKYLRQLSMPLQVLIKGEINNKVETEKD